MTRPLRNEVSRIEAFSDAVFALSATLLVVSLEVPDSFAELVKGLDYPPPVCDRCGPIQSKLTGVRPTVNL
jgi:hypothetical protein